MKTNHALSFIILSVGLIINAFASDDSEAAGKAREAAMMLGKTLQGRLVEAIQTGGITNALDVCYLEAPQIAAEVSQRMGVEVSRTALKTRNPDNQPDEWETQRLAELESRLQAGEDPATLETYAWITTGENDEREFRFMKAIITQPNCLACHGPEVDDQLLSAIRDRYPADLATGFLPNSLPGAFSIKLKPQ